MNLLPVNVRDSLHRGGNGGGVLSERGRSTGGAIAGLLGLALLVSGLWMVYRANVFGFGKSMRYVDYQAVDTNTSTEVIRKALGRPDTIGGPFAEAGGRLVEVWFYLESVKRSDGTRCDVTFEVETYGEKGRVTGKALGGCN